MEQPGLDNRHRDKNGQIARKHGNTLISTLRETYGAKFAPGIGGSKFSNLFFPDVSIEAQKSITDFLDRETAHIDQLIEKKHRLAMLLGERRLSVINQAVTRGIGFDRPNDEINFTGDVWFPELPADWRIARLRDVARYISDGPHVSPSYEDSGILFISSRNIKVNKWQFDDAKYISNNLYEELCQKFTPEVGDVLYTKGGTTGVARVVDFIQPFQIWVHVALIKLRAGLANPFFIAHVLNSKACYDQSQLYTRGATNNDLGLNRMINIRFPLPPLTEQKCIVSAIDNAVPPIDQLLDKIQTSVDRLKERRVSLITAAVTGHIEVTSWRTGGTTDRRLDDIEAEMAAATPSRREQVRA